MWAQEDSKDDATTINKLNEKGKDNDSNKKKSKMLEWHQQDVCESRKNLN